MKKKFTMIICLVLVLSLAGCDNQKGNEVKKTIEGNMKTYSEMEDGILFSC